jgi:hypothetical protein
MLTEGVSWEEEGSDSDTQQSGSETKHTENHLIVDVHIGKELCQNEDDRDADITWHSDEESVSHSFVHLLENDSL